MTTHRARVAMQLWIVVCLSWGCSEDPVARDDATGDALVGDLGLADGVVGDLLAGEKALGDGPAGDGPAADGPVADGPGPAAKIWATTYYAAWMQGTLPPDKIDYGALTHVIHFAVVPKTDGSLDAQANGMTTAKSTAAVQAAHAAGKKILVSVGGAGSASGFVGASAPAVRPTFISNIVQLMSARGYDGVDIDWEPLTTADATSYVALIKELRTALDQTSPKPLLTAAVAQQPAIIAQVQAQLDQVNVMTYDMSGAWPGWVTWHNAPIYDGGCTFASTGAPVPSAHALLQGFITAGVPAAKLGIGIDFYGYIWSGGTGTTTGGVTGPCQVYTSDPQVNANASYATIMDTYYQVQHYKWDAGAKAAYLGIDGAGSANDKFISYDDEKSVAEKVAYAKAQGLGGVFVWELGGGYRPGQPAGQQDVLLQALKQDEERMRRLGLGGGI